MPGHPPKSLHNQSIRHTECDFAVSNNGIWNIFQVTLQLNEENREREINGLTTAAKFMKLKEGTIITYDEEDRLKHQGIDIKSSYMEMAVAFFIVGKLILIKRLRFLYLAGV